MSCPLCSPSRRIWVIERGERKPVHAHCVTLIRAVDKVLELWAGRSVVGTMTSWDGHYPALSEAARRIGGNWVQVHRNAWARIEAVESFYPRGDGGADLRVAGVSVEASRRCWRFARSRIAL